MDSDVIRSLLKRNNYSFTRARRQIFAALAAKGPLSVASLARACSNVNRATIYRNIALFESLGIAHRVNMGWKYKIELSEPYIAHHHHLHCDKCGKLFPIEDRNLEKAIKNYCAKTGFEESNHQLEIYGICPDCYTV